MTAELASGLSQALCVALLALLGARVGWTIDRRLVPTILGPLFAGGIGIELAIAKLSIH